MATSFEDFLRGNRLSTGSDRRKVALVVQGGGMRGVYSMGALAELEDRSLSDAFDVVIGASAGAVNSAFLLAGQANEGVRIYVDMLSSRKFVFPLRFWKIVDIDYFVDTVLKRLAPLNVQALHASPTLLQVILTDADTGGAAIFTNREEGYDFFEVVRATAALPSLYNKRIPLGDNWYVDGGIADSVPVLRAADSGATEVLAVVTRESGFRRAESSRRYRFIARLMARGQSYTVRRKLGAEDTLFNQSMDLLEGLSSRPGFTSWCVRPSGRERLVGRTTSNKAKLLDCANMGREDMRRVLEGPCGPDAQVGIRF
jgi:predicted patatin/cPLA2 family phospholipase